MTDTDDRQLRPADDSFPYYLEVNDHHNPENGVQHYPRNGWACLWRHAPEEPISDANPSPVAYIQEQSLPGAENGAVAEQDPDAVWNTIACDSIRPHHLSNPVGWEAGPGRVWEFIETVRDDYYEHGLKDPDELPVRVLTNGPTTVENLEGEERDVYEIYFCDPEGGEYLMWNSDELYYEEEPNSELIQKVLTAFGNAYEDPAAFLDKWGSRRVQVETCDPTS